MNASIKFYLIEEDGDILFLVNEQYTTIRTDASIESKIFLGLLSQFCLPAQFLHDLKLLPQFLT